MRRWPVRQWVRRHVVGLFIAGVAVAPALYGVWPAAAEPAAPLSRTEVILRSMAKDPTVLINVTMGDMPSSGDVLNLGKRSTRALERCLADNVDDAMRRTCAELLGYLGDRRALPTLRTALEDWDPAVRAIVVDALRRIPDPASYAPLMKLYARRDEAPHIRAAILGALGELSSHDAVTVLRRELRHEAKEERQGDFRYSAFRGLWASRHLVARATLEQDVGYALRSDDEALVLAGTEAAAELRAPSLVAPLTELVDHENVEIRNKSVHALGLVGSASATRVLTREMPRVREARMLNNIAFALERLDTKEYEKTIAQLVGHKQAVIRLNAAFVLGDVKRPQGLPLLLGALEDPSEYVQASAIVAIGKLGDKAGIPALERFVTHANPALREEAIYAINAIEGGRRKGLIYRELFASEYARSYQGAAMRHRAAIALGKAGDKRVRSYLLDCFDNGGCDFAAVRDYVAQDDSATVTRRLYLSWARGRGELFSEVARRHPAGLLELTLGERDAASAAGDLDRLRRSVDLVGAIGKAADRSEIGRHLRSRDTRLRLHTATALIRLEDPAASQRLFTDLDNLPVDWLPSFVRIVSAIDEAPARAALGPELAARTKGPDLEVAMACAAVLLAWDPEQGFFRFLDALAADTARERELAEFYLDRERATKLTWVMRRALARETRPYTRDRLRQLLDRRG